MDRNKPLFYESEQRIVVQNNNDAIVKMSKAKTILEWNSYREQVMGEFRGTPRESIMLFGYIDGILHKKILIDARNSI